MFAVLLIFLTSSWATPTPTGDTGSSTPPGTTTGDTGTAPTKPTKPTKPTTPGTDPTTSDTAADPTTVTAATLAGEVGGCHCASGQGGAPWLLMSLGAVGVATVRRRGGLR